MVNQPQNKEQGYKDLFLEVPVFRWIAEKETLADELLEALASNLIKLGRGGKDILKVLLAKHGMETEEIGALLKAARHKPVASYERFSFLGYDGTISKEFKFPVDELKALKKEHDFIIRGLHYSERGTLLLNANVFASYVQTRIMLIYVQNIGFYAYDQVGKWHLIDDRELGKKCRNILHEAQKGIWKTSWQNEYMNALKLEVDQVESLDTCPDYINLRNGMLNLKTLELVPHDPSFYSSIQIPTSYNPDARCPIFNKFLKSIFEEDSERIDLLQEAMGYMLTKDRKLQKAFILLGKGSNGKSVLAEIIRLIAGAENVSNVPLSKLSERFGLDNLPGKTVNISTENELGDKHLNTQNFKAITGSDTLNIEQKYRQSFSCQLYCKLLILVNKLPKTKDHSHGYYRRLVIIPFNKVFSEEEQDKELLSKLTTELEGILFFALQGYQRLLQQDYRLTESKVVNQALVDYKEEQNPVLRFIRDEFKVTSGASVLRPSIYPAFHTWCHRNGYEEFSSLGRQKFWDLFRAAEAELGLCFTTKKISGDIYLEDVELRSHQRSVDELDTLVNFMD